MHLIHVQMYIILQLYHFTFYGIISLVLLCDYKPDFNTRVRHWDMSVCHRTVFSTVTFLRFEFSLSLIIDSV